MGRAEFEPRPSWHYADAVNPHTLFPATSLPQHVTRVMLCSGTALFFSQEDRHMARGHPPCPPPPLPNAASQPQSDRANPAHGQQDQEALAEGDRATNVFPAASARPARLAEFAL